MEIRAHQRLLSEIMQSYRCPDDLTDRLKKSSHCREMVPLAPHKCPLPLVPRNSETKVFKMEFLFSISNSSMTKKHRGAFERNLCMLLQER